MHQQTAWCKILLRQIVLQYSIYLVMVNQNYSDSAAHAALIARTLSLDDEDKRSTYDLTAYRH